MDEPTERPAIVQVGQFAPGEQFGRTVELDQIGPVPVLQVDDDSQLEEALRHHRIGAVVLDGTEKGLQALVSTKSLSSSLPVVMLIDAGQARLLRDCLERGLDSYVIREESWEDTWSVLEVLLKRWIGADAPDWQELSQSVSPVSAPAELHDDSFWVFFEAAPVGIKILDESNLILHANTKLQTMLGYSESELRQMTEQELICEDDRDRAWESFQSLVRGETDFSTVTIDHIHKNGAMVPTSLGRAALREGDKLKYVFEVGVTLTESRTDDGDTVGKPTTGELTFVDELVSGIAHDLRNILTLISLDTETMRMQNIEGVEGDETTRTLERIVEAAQRGHRIADRINQLGRPPGERVEVDLREYLDDFGDLLQALLPDEASLNLQSCDEPVVVDADASQLDQIVMNLVRNAAEAIDDDGEVSIVVDSRQLDEAMEQATPKVGPGEYVTICVTDTGHGMDEKTRERIFEPYFSTKKGDSDRGLGLANVHRAVRDLDGGISVESEPGQGSTFTVYLPRHPQADS